MIYDEFNSDHMFGGIILQIDGTPVLKRYTNGTMRNKERKPTGSSFMKRFTQFILVFVTKPHDAYSVKVNAVQSPSINEPLTSETENAIF